MTYLLTQMMLYMLCTLILGLILGWLIWGRLAADLRKAEADRAGLSAQLKARGDGSDETARIKRLNADLDACRKQRQAHQDEIDHLNRQLELAGSSLTTTPVASVSGNAAKPSTLTAARNGMPDDLKLIKGVGPKMETMLNSMGFYHYDQIAEWSASELAWVDDNLEGFKGRASRDEWIPQAKILARGGQTEFSSRGA